MQICGNGRVAIVTGAGHGIGAATADWLERDGWAALRADCDVDTAASGAVQVDVGQEADVERLVAIALARFGRLDAIVSNAGISRFKPLRETSLGDWNTVLATNLTATFLLARAAEPHLRQAKGSIVTIASTRAHMSEPGTVAYSASKGGIVALTHALAISLAPDVRVNCISPGWIDTGKHGTPSAGDNAQHPAGRVGQPDDIASAVAYLLSDQSRFMTGSELIIDGGMTRKMIYV